MKNVTYFFILFLLILTPPLFADKNSNEEVLKRLDRIIDNKTAYHVQKEKEIVDLKQRLHVLKIIGRNMNFAVLCLTLICIIKLIPHCIILMEK